MRGWSLLVDHEACQLEFISHANAMLCTRMETFDLAPRGDVLWKRVRSKMVFQTSCERDCYVCRFPVRDYGLVVKGVHVVRDGIPDTLIDVYCSYVDPIVAHFNDHHNAYILVCKHCMRIVRNLSEAPVRMEYYATYFDDYEYFTVCEESHMLERYAFLLRSAEIGRDSRAVKVNDQFWVADRRDYQKRLHERTAGARLQTAIHAVLTLLLTESPDTTSPELNNSFFSHIAQREYGTK